MKRKIKSFNKVIGLIICLLVFSSVGVYASPNNNQPVDAESFVDYFNIDESYLYEEVSNSSSNNINNYRYITFNRGINRYITPTFSSQRYLVGEGTPNTEVGIMVYTIESGTVNENQIIFQKIGASGLFNQTVYFDAIGDNYVLIAVKKDGDVVYRNHIVNRKAEETKNRLEVLNITLFD
ncbi:hypothetical protein EDC19_1359 [Natranaerovirga hydrolytica]|uniref:Uncharacterized protein n=1 Tax=Natranaerovirga hydrolytica TaxID=680378 RepID=A0A4V2Q0G4_9FIRM|nr:hypothetical protein [Natranaerovirga hydrolytica]TCK93171.1 hypothetical protein EDC19_1359 [Natranaerovirga hydrolytica]